MKALFVHDHFFFASKKGIIYSPGKLPYEAWNRYLDFFDHLTVAGRRGEIINDKKISCFDVSSGPGVRFLLLPSLTQGLGSNE